LEARWRAFASDRLGTLTPQLDLRIGLASDQPDMIAPSIDWARRAGRLGLTAQVGYAGSFISPAGQKRWDWLVWRAGAAYDLVTGPIAPPLQLGVEGYGEVVLHGHNDFSDTAGSTANAGPTLSVAKGRLWLTAGTLFGLSHDSPAVLVRAVIGVAL
jgi:hypothetical protein